MDSLYNYFWFKNQKAFSYHLKTEEFIFCECKQSFFVPKQREECCDCFVLLIFAYHYPHVHILLVNPFKQSKGLQTTLVIKYYIHNQLNLQELWIKVSLWLIFWKENPALWMFLGSCYSKFACQAWMDLNEFEEFISHYINFLEVGIIVIAC